MKSPKSRKAELPPNAMGGGKSHAEAAESAEFKMTELGSIPVDWEVKRLGDVGEPLMCKRILKSQTFDVGDVPFYKIGTFGGIADAYISRGLYESFRRKYPYPKKGDVLLSAAGTIGRTVVYDGKDGYFQDSNIVWVDNDETLVSNDYLYWWYKVISWNTEDGGIVTRLYNNNLKASLIVVPPLAEQRRIARALSDVDELISALGKLIEKKRNIKTGAMQQLLTGKTRLPGFGVRRTEFKQTELGPIPVDWEVMRLGDVCTDYAYGTGAEAVDYDGENKYIRITDIDEDSHLYSPLPLASPSFFSEGHVVKENDLLVARTGASVGKTYFYSKSDGKLIFAGFLMKANVKHAEGKFIFYLTLTDYYKRWVLSESARSGQPGINIRQLQSLLLPLPPLSEQKAIAAVLSDMDAEIAALEADRAKYERIKTGMMQELLTGKTRLKP